MTNYRIKTPDGEVHSVTAVTYVIDSLGLTFIGAENKNVALFRSFDWMQVVTDTTEAPVTTLPSTTDTAGSSEVSAPVASGE